MCSQNFARSRRNGAPPRRYTVAELFCGCGGFSYGFHKSGRFDVVFGNDIKDAALRTFVFNHQGMLGAPATINHDIRQVPLETITVKLAKHGLGVGDLDCLIGGPPCQGFSQMRRSVERKDQNIVRFKGYDRLNQDPRNDLVLRFLEIASVLQPKFIVIENVPQMLNHGHNGVLGGLVDEIKRLLEREMKYCVDVKVLNAADYGVPQQRERVFFIARREPGPLSFPLPTNVGHWITVKDAISDLPVPASGPQDELGGGDLNLYPQLSLSEFAQQMRSQIAFPHNHLTRRYEQRVINIVREMQPGETWDHAMERMCGHYERLIDQMREQGERRDKVRERLARTGKINKVFYRRYYWSAYTRLNWAEPALTITANANFLGSGRFTHPQENRGITMREAARLQSFDDDFRFITSATDDTATNKMGVGMDMIGEAVPPRLGEVFARHIANHLDGELEHNDTPALMSALACREGTK